jgi:hypothetical protein
MVLNYVSWESEVRQGEKIKYEIRKKDNKRVVRDTDRVKLIAIVN